MPEVKDSEVEHLKNISGCEVVKVEHLKNISRWENMLFKAVDDVSLNEARRNIRNCRRIRLCKDNPWT